MDAKKAPVAWRRWGRAKMDDGGRPHSAGTAREPQEQSCRDCSFYRAIDLPSGRVRRLCMLSGERLTTAATPCEHFMPGRWEEVWAAPDEPRQSLVCGLCGNAAPSTRRAALLGVVGCLSGHVVDGAAYPVHCRDFRARGGRHAA